MKLVVIYKAQSEHGRATEEFLREIGGRMSGEQARVVDPDSREGATIAQLYDIWQYPAVIVTQENGAMQMMWLGEPLPLVSEVVAYLRA